MGKTILIALLAVIVPYGGCFLYLWAQSRNPVPPKPRLSEEALRSLGILESVLTAHATSAENDLNELEKEQTRTKGRIDWISKWQSLYGPAGSPLLSWAELIETDGRRLALNQKTIIQEIKVCRLVIRGFREGARRSVLLTTVRPFDEWGPKVRQMIEDTELSMKKTAIGIGVNPRLLPEPAYTEWNILSLIRSDQESIVASQKKMYSDLVSFAGALTKLVERVPPIYDTLRFPF